MQASGSKALVESSPPYAEVKTPAYPFPRHLFSVALLERREAVVAHGIGGAQSGTQLFVFDVSKAAQDLMIPFVIQDLPGVPVQL